MKICKKEKLYLHKIISFTFIYTNIIKLITLLISPNKLFQKDETRSRLVFVSEKVNFTNFT